MPRFCRIFSSARLWDGNSLACGIRNVTSRERRLADTSRLGYLLFAGFFTGGNFASNQMKSVNLVLEDLTEYGVVAAAMPKESPAPAFHAERVTAVFEADHVSEMVAVLDEVRCRAEPNQQIGEHGYEIQLSARR